MSKNRRTWKRSKRRRKSKPCLYPVGTVVRVKQGVTVVDMPDMPMGGWSGTVSSVDVRSGHPVYCLQWDQATLDQMHPAYRKRCLRDEVEFDEYYEEEKNLILAGDEPATFEQPAAIVTRPLDPANRCDRLRAILGLSTDDPLPAVDRECLRNYHRYLTETLAFPFQANYTLPADDFFAEIEEYNAPIIGLAPDATEVYGLFCKVDSGKELLHVPLNEIEAIEEGPNQCFMADYTWWLANYSSLNDWMRDEPDDIFLVDGGSRRRPAAKLLARCVAYAVMSFAICGMLFEIKNSTMIGAGIGAALLGLSVAWRELRSPTSLLSWTPLASHRIMAGIITFVLCATVGAIAGTFLALLLGELPFAIAGGAAGGLLGWCFRRLELMHRHWVWGALAGSCLGAGGSLVLEKPAEALHGTVIGAATGLSAAVLLFTSVYVCGWLAYRKRPE